MVEANSVEPDRDKKERSGCRKLIIRSVCLLLALIILVSAYVFYAYHVRQTDNNNKNAEYAVKNAYAIAQACFVDHPSAEVTMEMLQKYGYEKSNGVTLTILNGRAETLKIKTAHDEGSKTFLINHEGSISSREK